MRAFLPPLLALCLLTPGAWAQSGPTEGLPDGFRALDRVRAVVDSEVVTQFELDRNFAQIAALGAGILDPEAREKWVREKRGELLDEQINTLLVIGEARKLDLEVGPQEIAGHLRQLEQQLGGRDNLEKHITSLGYRTLDEYQENVEREILKARTIRLRIAGRVRPSKEEVDRVFARDFHGGKAMTEVHAQHILVKMPNQLVTPQTLRKLSERAHEARALAVTDQRPWCDLAKEYSDDSNGPQCGELGWFSRCTLDSEFEREVFRLEPGTISDVVQTRFGYHVIRVLERRVTPIPDEPTAERLRRCVRMDIETANRIEAYDAYTKELRVMHHVRELP